VNVCVTIFACRSSSLRVLPVRENRIRVLRTTYKYYYREHVLAAGLGVHGTTCSTTTSTTTGSCTVFTSGTNSMFAGTSTRVTSPVSGLWYLYQVVPVGTTS
jgi:hypothetical protein